MTARALEAVEGRPPTTIDGLSRALGRSRERNVELVVEVRAQRTEERAFVERVARVVIALGEPRPPVVVINLANELGYHAERRLRQLSGRTR